MHNMLYAQAERALFLAFVEDQSLRKSIIITYVLLQWNK